MDHVFDLYWGGSERRITSLTVRIIAMNAIALIILAIGILYLGEYQSSIIQAKLETFKAEIEMVSTAMSESTLEEITVPSTNILQPSIQKLVINETKARAVIHRLGETTGRHLRMFNEDGHLIADSRKLQGDNGDIEFTRLTPPSDTLFTIEVLKNMARFTLNLIPDSKTLPPYPEPFADTIEYYPDTQDAIEGRISVSAWTDKKNHIFLSTAAPITKAEQVKGVVLMTRTARDIEDAIVSVWLDVLRVFAITLMITIFLSIYLAGLIARPLRKLMLAAEEVRAGKSRETEIPDLSHRKDEIGELSIVLRDMTKALWDRMDSIESFAADVSHELKNPLTSLKSAIETLSIVKRQEDRDKLLGIIEHDIRRLDRLITEISNASRLDSELSKESFDTIDLKNALLKLLDIYRDPMQRKSTVPAADNSIDINGVTLSLKIPEEGALTTLGLELRLNQVFQNLVSNALSFSKKGDAVTITALSRLNSIIITVEDQGPGIPESKLQSIFERFYSERPEHEDYGKHSGLGLSICKQIIDAHRGRIFAENKKDSKGEIHGAKFTVILNNI